MQDSPKQHLQLAAVIVRSDTPEEHSKRQYVCLQPVEPQQEPGC